MNDRSRGMPGAAVRSAGLAVRGVLAAVGAELLQLDAVGIVATVLLGDVVAVPAVHARHGDLGTDVGRLGHGECLPLRCSGYCRLRHMSVAATGTRSQMNGLASSGGRT